MARVQLPSVRLKGSEQKLVEAYAKEEGISVTDLIRRCVIGEALGNLPVPDGGGDLVEAVWEEYGDNPPKWVTTADQAIQDDDLWFLIQFTAQEAECVAEAAAKSELRDREWIMKVVEEAAAKVV